MKSDGIVAGILMLLAITMVSGFLLAQAYRFTYPRIQEQKRAEAERLNREIFPAAATFEAGEERGRGFVSARDASGVEIGRVWDVRAPGYSGFIGVKAGVAADGRIARVKILEHGETPGLGAKIAKDAFLGQFEGQELGRLHLKKDNPAGAIDAIAGATISSRAVTDGIRKSLLEAAP
jgi:electron transport complex protein RnfG